jgi:hypothetical protein
MRKNALLPYKIIDAGDMSGNLTSSVTDIQYMDNICMELVWTGTPTGSFSVEGSLTGDNWIAISLTPSAPSGSAGSALLDMNQLSFPKIRIVYTATSGSGTLNAWIGGKML